jgi:hypothetical protein
MEIRLEKCMCYARDRDFDLFIYLLRNSSLKKLSVTGDDL